MYAYEGLANVTVLARYFGQAPVELTTVERLGVRQYFRQVPYLRKKFSGQYCLGRCWRISAASARYPLESNSRRK